MRSLIQLRLDLESVPQPIAGHDRFIALAVEEGLAIKTVRFPGKVGDRVDVPYIHGQIEGAQGYWIRQPMLLSDAQVRAIVERRLQEGAIAFCELRWQDRMQGAEYFQELGLESTSIRATRRDFNENTEVHDALVSVRRSSYPFGFRDADLFRDVEELLLQQANGIGCFGNSQPILAIPSSEILLLDQRTDYFVASLPRPEFPVMAMTHKPGWRGRIIASNVGVVHDAYEGPFGDKFPGIEAADNLRFARNLLRIIAGGKGPSDQTWEYAFALVSEIETDLARTTALVLDRGSRRRRLVQPAGPAAD